ncbi:nitroreductase family protein [Paenibacillus baekrokdamisoli]|uniref:nitroreductase family protein n=1 Tax=Paenibacillus baekrokdamisoli TaxID=1712516 RepID=UPI000F7878AC|nr:nitroreductase [Paenibacillus baekrokdamisoli]
MNVIDAMKKRRAIRQFDGRLVEEDKIRTLLETAILAPNDRMRQPWHFYIIQGAGKVNFTQLAEEYLQERFPTKPNLVQESLKVLNNTPLLIVITADQIANDADASEDNVFASCCAAHSIWLAAEELGLGCVWRTRGIALVRDARLNELLHCPPEQKVIGTLCLGYPAEQPPIPARTSYTEKVTWV